MSIIKVNCIIKTMYSQVQFKLDTLDRPCRKRLDMKLNLSVNFDMPLTPVPIPKYR